MKKGKMLYVAMKSALAYINYVRKNPDLKPMVMIAHEFTATGASLLFANLYQSLVQKNYAIVILTANTDSIAPSIAEKYESNVYIVRLPFSPRIRRLFLKIFKSVGVEFALCNTVISGVFARDLKETGIRSVYMIHEMSASMAILNAADIAREIAACADTVVFPAETVCKRYMEYTGIKGFSGETICMPQGYYKSSIDIPDKLHSREQTLSELGIEKNAIMILGAGAINFGKGVDLLLLALKKLVECEKECPYHLLWMGTTNEHDAFFQWLLIQIRAYNLTERVHFTGFIGDDETYKQILCSSDVYVLSSREDSFPSTIIEAMYCGVPIVSFQESGGGSEYLQKQNQGVCVPMADVDALNDAINTIVGQPSAYANADTISKAKSDFDFRSYVNRLEHLLYKENISVEE